MTPAPKLLFLAGSARAGSHNRKLARLASRVAEDSGFPATHVELGDYPMPLYDGDLEARDGAPEAAHKLKALLLDHRGAFIASPEYNASVAPLLKNTIDWISHIPPGPGETPMQAFKSCVFALGAASPGGTGGLRGLMALRAVLELGLGAFVLPDQALVSRAHQAFTAEGRLENADNQARLEAVVRKLARTAQVLHG